MNEIQSDRQKNPASEPPLVSIVKIKDGKIERAVEQAIELLGGIESLTKDKDRIMLKPNLVSNDPRSTTNPQVIHALAQLMKDAGKEVTIGEGSAAAAGFNFTIVLISSLALSTIFSCSKETLATAA